MKKFLHVLNHSVLISTFTDWDDEREQVKCGFDEDDPLEPLVLCPMGEGNSQSRLVSKLPF